MNPPSAHVTLEVAILASASPSEKGARIALVLASDADVRTYVCESLQHHIPIEVITTGSVAAALDIAARSTPGMLIVTHDERKLLRHLPAVPAVLLSEDLPAAEALDERLAPLVLIRGAFRAQQLIDVATSLLAGGDGKSRI